MTRTIFLLTALLGVLSVAIPAVAQESSASPSWSIRQQTDLLKGQKNPGIEINHLSDDDVKTILEFGIDSEAGQAQPRLFVEGADSPILGRVHLAGNRLVFEPRFRLVPNVTYIATFDHRHIRPVLTHGPLKFEFRFESGQKEPLTAPELTAVGPIQNELPQNLLRMYLHFSQPMKQGVASDHIRFLEGERPLAESPYLEIPQELWSPDGKRLTLLFDPGRIKRGLVRHEQLGPPFEVGKTYTLVVKEGWKSATGVSLQQDFRFTFTVARPDRTQPAVSRWKIVAPKSDTLDPMHIRFGEPLDVGMLQHSLAVIPVGKDIAVTGKVEVADDGRSWEFTPESPWQTGAYTLAANPRLEDRSGNSLAQSFERDMTAPPLHEKPETTLRFDIGQIHEKVKRQRPNVVIILADDLGWRDLSCEGSTFYESPNIDRICNEGIRFTQGYAACQVCSPSRAAIMTGKSPARLKITDYIGAPSGTDWKRNTKLLPAFYKRQLPDEETTLAEAFREAGYKTFFAGKWHLGSTGSHPEDHGFDVNVGGHRAGTPPGGYFVPYKNPKMKDGPAGECLPIRLGQDMAHFIEQNKNGPFFAVLAFYSVHSPIQSTEKLWKKYREKATSIPPVDRRFLIDRTLPVRQVQDHPLYAGMIESMDNGVGKVLDKLDQFGLSDNTIVVFTSDNGGVSSGDGNSTSNLPLRGGKGRQWEGGIREPFYIRWPGKIDAGSSSDTPVIGTDIYPTLLDLTGLPARPDQHRDGVSLKPLLEGRSIRERALIWHYPHYGNQGGEPSSIIRQGDWKLIRYLEDGRRELYNVAKDPEEQNDLASREAMRTGRMVSQLQFRLADVNAEMPVTNPNYDDRAWQQWKTKIIEQRWPKMERTHAAFLEPSYKPGNGWWEKPDPSSGKDR